MWFIVVLVYLLGFIIISAGDLVSSSITYCGSIVLDLLLVMRFILLVFFVRILMCPTFRVIIIIIVIVINLRW